MSTRPQSDLVSLTRGECLALIERVQAWAVPAADLDMVIRSLNTLLVVSLKLEAHELTIRQLRQMFHLKTETSRVLLEPVSNDETDELPPAQEGIPGEDHFSLEPARDQAPIDKRKGHGRRPASAYTGATTVSYAHHTMEVGQRCPACHRGNLYDRTGPGFIRVTGNPPFTATRHCPQKLRCATCGQEYEAELPEDIAQARQKNERYAPSAKAMLALLKYGSGMPLYRLETLQDMLGIPFSTSTQWDILVEPAQQLLPILLSLYTTAAREGSIFYNDDTFVRIVKVRPPEDTGHDPKRTGLQTTAIVVQVGPRQITLYYSGRNHAGENLARLLSERGNDRDPPIQMCDAAARNIPRSLVTLLVHCLVHGRRKFVELLELFPQQTRHVITQLAKVFHYDRIARSRGYNAQQRLVFHQRVSQPIMDELKQWMLAAFNAHQVEPNSSLGKAFTYMLNHWKELTGFLVIPGAPLDSNVVERALKKAILNRKNAYFFRTEYGALVGDLFMSLIETCRANQVNAFHYLTTLLTHAAQLRDQPESWLPWNYHLQLETNHIAA